MMLLTELEHFIREDIGFYDYPEIVPGMEAKAKIIANETGIIAGLKEGIQIFRYFNIDVSLNISDGDEIKKGDIVCIINGSAGNILRAERLVLNFLSRMSGIATLTAECVNLAKLKNKKVRVACTRKTTPGFRKYEKKAVWIGGGDSHRFNLSDSIIIKDNHIKLIGLEQAIKSAKKASFTKKIEIEVESIDDAVKAAELGVDIIMFDNMDPEKIKKGINILEKKGLRDKVIIEASGGITPDNITEYAKTGVDVISIGSLTTSAKWLDLSLEII
ncbi:MAG: carboxylating nicotinate-nucleotide diphosphorylase [Methanosarcinales archaeon]